MNKDTLERVLACDRLPTLPAVAVRVIELTQNHDVSIKDLAETIHNDQALAAKVIRTVNSSFFGLRQRCSSINQAIVLLGLAAVKTLALGFSLVSAISATDDGQAAGGTPFDYDAYWRRSLFTGIAARTIAKHGARGGEEECFLGGLLQDVGMIALYQALGDEYAQLLARCGGDHRLLAELEIEALDTQHADIGALLASRWKLPDELVMPIKYHERPSAAPPKHQRIVRAVALGNIASDILTAAEPAGLLSRYAAKAKEWFDLDATAAEEILRSISASTMEVARLLQIKTGEIADASAILEKAHERLISITIPAEGARPGGDAASRTGELPGRRQFDQCLVTAFEQAAATGGAVAVALFELDGLAEIDASRGGDDAEAVAAAFAEQLHRELARSGGHAFALDDGRFAALLLRSDRLMAARTVESVRRHFNAAAIDAPGGPVTASASAGMAWADAESIGRFADAGEFLRVTERALGAARHAGGNTLRLYTPPAAAA